MPRDPLLSDPMPREWQPPVLKTEQLLMERTHQALLDAICTGRLAPGERLTQENMADMFGISRQPVSHALVLLKQQGFVREAGRRGLEVAPVDPDYLKALFNVRAALDALAAGAAALRARSGQLLFARFDDVLSAGREAAERADLPALVAHDIAFHSLVAELSGNPVIQEITHQHWAHIRRGIAVALQDPAFHNRCWAEHAAIAQAIGAGEEEQAARLSRDHCNVAGTETGQRLMAAAGPGPA